MFAEEVIEYALRKPGAEETYPFGPDTLVVKVGGKIFALFGVQADAASVNLKCDPIMAEELRAEWADISPGFHMNKRHWNTVNLHGVLPSRLMKEMVDHSYDLVFKGLPASIRVIIQATGHGAG